MTLKFISRTDWPPTATLKAIDLWCGCCYLVVFSALVEYCVVLFLTREGEDGGKERRARRAAVIEKWAR